MHTYASRTIRLLHATLTTAAVLAVLVFGVLTLFAVPAPNAQTAIEVSGTVISLGRPDPDTGDLPIVLDGNRHYYVNRVEEAAYFPWEQLLAEVRPGDRLILTVATPLAWRLVSGLSVHSGTIAGIRTTTSVYMDPELSAQSWTTQAQASSLTTLALIVLGICLSPTLVNRVKRHPPTSPRTT
jgi:hypothetical protein